MKKIFNWGISVGVKITGLSEQFILFLVMGGINTAFYYTLYATLIYCHLHYTLSVLIATVCGVLFNFHTFGKVVFKDFRTELLPRFISVYCVNYIVNVSGLAILGLVGLENKYLAGIVMVLPVAFLGYALNKHFVFNQPKEQP